MPFSNQDPAQPLDRLQSLVELLTHPDLTIAQANDLRPRLMDLLEALETRSESPTARPCPSR